MAPICPKAVGFSRALSLCLSFFLSVCVTSELLANGVVGLPDQPQSSSVSTSTTTSFSTINTSSTTATTPPTLIVSTPTPLWRTQREAPQRYVFSFPAVNFDNNVYEQSLVIATTRPHNVTVDLVTTYMLLSAYGPYVINNNSAPLTLVLAQNGMTSLHTSVMSVEITSSDVVNVYAFDYFLYNIDAILVRDVTQLGERYSVMTLPFTRLSSNQRSFFVVTASEDNTTVVIRKPAGVDVDLSSTSVFSQQSTGDGRLVTTTLNKLQTVSTIHDGDLTGLDIRSDKPLALSFGLNRNMMTGGCCRDHMWVQLPGVQVWGKEYVTFPTTAMGPSSTDVYYLAAAENDTVVYVDCDERLTLSDAYEWTNTTLDTASFHYLVSDKPVVVIKAVRGTRYVLDPCMLTLTDTSRWTTAMTFALPTKALWDSKSLKFTVTIITEEAQTDSLTINGEHLQANWKSISAGKGNSSRALVGGELTGLSRGVVYALSSVSGTTRMAVYVTGASSFHGLCYALGGDAPETNSWNPISTCPETNTYALTTTIVNTAYTTKDAGYTDTTETTLLHVSTTAGEGTSHTESNSGTYTDLSTTWKASTTAKEVTTEVTGVSDSVSTSRWDGSTTLGQVTTSSSIKSKFTVDKQPATENGSTKPTLDFETTNRELQTESTQNSKITSEDTTVREGIKGTTRKENLTIRTETPKEILLTTTDNTITSQGFKSTATDTTSTTSAASSTHTTPTKRPTTTKPSQPPKPAQRIQPCYCKQNTPRSSSPKTPAQEEEEEAAVVAVVEELKVNLIVARGNTSASVRKVSSAPDDRSSSFAMGAFAIVSLSLVLAVVLSFDCIRVVQWVHAKKTASRSMKQLSA